MAESKSTTKDLDPVSLATWARLKAAGKIAKPNGAERSSKPKPAKKSRRG